MNIAPRACSTSAARGSILSPSSPRAIETLIWRGRSARRRRSNPGEAGLRFNPDVCCRFPRRARGVTDASGACQDGSLQVMEGVGERSAEA